MRFLDFIKPFTPLGVWVLESRCPASHGFPDDNFGIVVLENP